MGANKFDLLLQYVSNPNDGAAGLPCSDPTGPGTASRQAYAEVAMSDMASKSVQVVRVLGAGFQRGDLFLWRPSNGCQAKYWQKFGAMLNYAAGLDTDPATTGVQGLILTSAGLTNGVTLAQVFVRAYDAGNVVVAELTSNLLTDEPENNAFRIRVAQSGSNAFVSLPSTARYVRMELLVQGPSGSYAKFDDVRVTMLY